MSSQFFLKALAKINPFSEVRDEIIVICSRKSHHLMSILGSFDKPLKKDEMFRKDECVEL